MILTLGLSGNVVQVNVHLHTVRIKLLTLVLIPGGALPVIQNRRYQGRTACSHWPVCCIPPLLFDITPRRGRCCLVSRQAPRSLASNTSTGTRGNGRAIFVIKKIANCHRSLSVFWGIWRSMRIFPKKQRHVYTSNFIEICMYLELLTWDWGADGLGTPDAAHIT